MVNNVAEFLHEYKERDFEGLLNQPNQEIYVFLVEHNGTLVQNTNPLLTDEEVTDRYLGDSLGCFDMEKGKRCGEGKNCVACQLRFAVSESLDSKKPITKRLITKNLDYQHMKSERYFHLSTVFPHKDKNQVMVILDDVTKSHQLVELTKVEHYLRENAQLLDFDSILQYAMDNSLKVISSEFAAVGIIGKQSHLSKKSSMVQAILVN